MHHLTAAAAVWNNALAFASACLCLHIARKVCTHTALVLDNNGWRNTDFGHSQADHGWKAYTHVAGMNANISQQY